jgi:hypothetical protein
MSPSNVSTGYCGFKSAKRKTLISAQKRAKSSTGVSSFRFLSCPVCSKRQVVTRFRITLITDAIPFASIGLGLHYCSKIDKERAAFLLNWLPPAVMAEAEIRADVTRILRAKTS